MGKKRGRPRKNKSDYNAPSTGSISVKSKQGRHSELKVEKDLGPECLLDLEDIEQSIKLNDKLALRVIAIHSKQMQSSVIATSETIN